MKKTLSVILAVCLFAALATGCAAKNAKPEKAEYNLDELASSLESSGAFSDILSKVDIKVASALYGFDAADAEECVLLCSTGATTEEIGLFKCADDEAAGRILAAAQKRADSQRKAYESYAPAEMPKLDDAIIKQEGVFVFYIVSADAAKAAEVFGNE